MRRREFIISGIASVAGAAIGRSAFGERRKRHTPKETEEHLYDQTCFAASPRVWFDKRQNKAYISVLPEKGKDLEMELFVGGPGTTIIDRLSHRASGPVKTNDSIDFPVNMDILGGPSELNYQLRYRETGIQDKKNWEYTPVRTVKTPYLDLEKGDELKILLIADDHTADDADIGNRILQDEQLRKDRLTGDCINTFVKNLLENPGYRPEKGSEEAKLPNAWSMARALVQILQHEDPSPHAVVLLGDTNPFGFYYKWTGLGLPHITDTTLNQINNFAELFHIYQRKKFSLLSSFTPIYLVKGNHDAEQAFKPELRNASIPHRIKYWKQPEWGQSWYEQNYFPLFFGPYDSLSFLQSQMREQVMLMLFDSESWLYTEPKKIEEFTLGDSQKYDFQNLLKNSLNIRYKLALIHRLMGGMFGGPNGDLDKAPYARGPLAVEEDYCELKELGEKYLNQSLNPSEVEQIELTKMLMRYGVDKLIMGHDHIYSQRKIKNGSDELELIAAGSTKHKGEIYWWDEKYLKNRNDSREGVYSGQWQYFYGSHGGVGEALGSGEADFWGPSGYVRLKINKDGIKSEYIRSDYNYPHTNIPEQYHIGDVLPSKLHSEFPRKGPFGQ